MNSGQPGELRRARLAVRGAVQGVGFRPFVYRLAAELGVRGWVSNSADGVLIEGEASSEQLDLFIARVHSEKPPLSLVQAVECQWLEPVGYAAFEIVPSDQTAAKRTLVLPDIATCPDCLRELFDPGDRRFGYPFINCTHCGPRFTIIQELPYDRVHTSMRGFTMCAACQAEYEDPRNRRFHAQPNACALCGPQIALWDQLGQTLEREQAALERAAAGIREGLIVAVKGLGGFHLVVAAHREDAVQRLRQLKRREAKPFALLFPSLAAVREECALAQLEEQLLSSAQAPIVLLRRRSVTQDGPSQVCGLVAPGNPFLGVMLPSNPLHHLLMRSLRFPVVATSGNLAEEPICIDEREAIDRLGSTSDLFLVHNRPIVRHADDSIVRVMAGRESVLRRARGYAPLPVSFGRASSRPDAAPAGATGLPPGKSERHSARSTLAVGAQLKNSIALAVGDDVFISQHIGDLETPQAYAAFQRVIADFEKFYAVQPELVVADAHPDYLSTRFANDRGIRVLRVQHHYAHVLSAMGEQGLQEEPEAFGVSWDGTGYGSDQTVWGGEFLNITPHGFARFAHFRTFQLPGGDQAIKEPRRTAIGLLHAAFGQAGLAMDLPPTRAFSARELSNLEKMMAQQLNSPFTSSAGRLFDAVASVLGLRQRAAFEGQAAMDLEFALEGVTSEERYPVAFNPALSRPTGEGDAALIMDWGPMLEALLEDQRKDLPVGLISMKFHNGLVEGIVQAARAAGKEHVVLSGGCFQNKYLTERAVSRLRQAGFRPFWHRLVPPNDGGIAFGQVVAARRALGRNG